MLGLYECLFSIAVIFLVSSWRWYLPFTQSSQKQGCCMCCVDTFTCSICLGVMDLLFLLLLEWIRRFSLLVFSSLLITAQNLGSVRYAEEHWFVACLDPLLVLEWLRGMREREKNSTLLQCALWRWRAKQALLHYNFINYSFPSA